MQREAATVRSALAQLESEGVVNVLEAGSALGGAPLGASSFESLVARTFDVLHVIADARDGIEGGEPRLLLGGETLALSAFALSHLPRPPRP